MSSSWEDCQKCGAARRVTRSRTTLGKRGPARENPGTLWGTAEGVAERDSYTIKLCAACDEDLWKWWCGR